MVKNNIKLQVHIPASAMEFLKLLKKNNNREWFNQAKEKFLGEQQSIEIFANALLQKLNMHDMIETPSGKKSLHRIYRDTRFSDNKTPYKTSWTGSFRRASQMRRGGYYFHIESNNSFIAGGFQGPNPQDLKRIRDDIAFDAAPLRKILRSKSFISTFETLRGQKVKTVPKGFDKDHEAIDLLRYKQFLLIRKFTDAEVLSENFLEEVNKTFKSMRPFLDYMSEVLSAGANGVLAG